MTTESARVLEHGEGIGFRFDVDWDVLLTPTELHELLGYVGGVVRWRGGRLVFFGGLFLLPLLAVLARLRAVVGLTVAGVVVFAASSDPGTPESEAPSPTGTLSVIVPRRWYRASRGLRLG